MKRVFLSALAFVALGCLVIGNMQVHKTAETIPVEPAGITIFHK